MFNKLNQILKDNKVFTVAKIDGFLAAIISSPNLIHLIEWTLITKIKDPDLEILFEFYTQIYLGLREGNYLPIFIHSGVEDLSIDLCNWIEGYTLGKNLWDPKIVKLYQLEINELFSKIMQLSPNLIQNSDYCSNILSQTCINIYKFWSKNYC